MNADEGPATSYQRVLRAVGGFLDEEQPRRFRLVEGLDGFTLVLEAGQGEPQLRAIPLELAVLEGQADQLVRGKHVFHKRSGPRWNVSDSDHEDVLRALGFELDDSRARGICLDQLDDGLLLTYSYLDPSQGYGWRKHMVVLRAPQVREILQSAYSRRRRRGLLKALRRP